MATSTTSRMKEWTKIVFNKVMISCTTRAVVVSSTIARVWAQVLQCRLSRCSAVAVAVLARAQVVAAKLR